MRVVQVGGGCNMCGVVCKTGPVGKGMVGHCRSEAFHGQLSKGVVGELGELLAQRFKSIGLAMSGDDAAASAVRPIGMREGGLTTYQELEKAKDYQSKELKPMEQWRRLS